MKVERENVIMNTARALRAGIFVFMSLVILGSFIPDTKANGGLGGTAPDVGTGLPPWPAEVTPPSTTTYDPERVVSAPSTGVDILFSGRSRDIGRSHNGNGVDESDINVMLGKSNVHTSSGGSNKLVNVLDADSLSVERSNINLLEGELIRQFAAADASKDKDSNADSKGVEEDPEAGGGRKLVRKIAGLENGEDDDTEDLTGLSLRALMQEVAFNTP